MLQKKAEAAATTDGIALVFAGLQRRFIWPMSWDPEPNDSNPVWAEVSTSCRHNQEKSDGRVC